MGRTKLISMSNKLKVVRLTGDNPLNMLSLNRGFRPDQRPVTTLPLNRIYCWVSISDSKTPSTIPRLSNENDTVLFRIRLPSRLQRWKRSPKTDRFENALQSGTILKTVLFENAVFLVWTAKTILSENDDVTTTPPPGCRPLNREYPR